MKIVFVPKKTNITKRKMQRIVMKTLRWILPFFSFKNMETKKYNPQQTSLQPAPKSDGAGGFCECFKSKKSQISANIALWYLANKKL